MWFRFLHSIRTLSSKKVVTIGIPMMVFLVGGSFLLEQFAQLRYEFQKTQKTTAEEIQKLHKRKKRKTLEEEYEILKTRDLDSWENIRGPRPWEEQPAQPQPISK